MDSTTLLLELALSPQYLTASRALKHEDQLFFCSDAGHSFVKCFHIRTRIDAYNFAPLIDRSDRDSTAITYLPINIENGTQHFYLLAWLLYLKRSGFSVYCLYPSEYSVNHIYLRAALPQSRINEGFNYGFTAKELITSTLDVCMQSYLRNTQRVHIKSFTRYIYSAGKSKSSPHELRREAPYSTILYCRDAEILALRSCTQNYEMKKISNPKSAYLERASQLLSLDSGKPVIGWFPSIKECAVINHDVINILLDLARCSLANLVVGLHPMLKTRDADKHRILEQHICGSLPRTCFCSELIDSTVLSSLCNVIIGDVGSTIWDANDLEKPLVLLTTEDESDYDARLLSSQCFKEWRAGVLQGRTKPSQLRGRLMRILGL